MRMRQRENHSSSATSVYFATGIVVISNLFILHLCNLIHVSGFLIAVPQQIQNLSLPSTIKSSLVLSRILLPLQQQQFDDDNDCNDDDEVFLTPIQIRTIRKDIIRKRANKKLPTIYYSNYDTIHKKENDDGTLPVSVEQQIVEALISHQLVQVRGIASFDDDTRTIRSEAEQLAYRLQKRVQQQQQDDSIASSTSKLSLAYVFVVEMKGHMATLFYYIPQQQLTAPFHQQYQKTITAILSSSTGSSRLKNVSPKVQLRTTGKRNDWNKRPKALRDNAGQIIK